MNTIISTVRETDTDNDSFDNGSEVKSIIGSDEESLEEIIK